VCLPHTATPLSLSLTYIQYYVCAYAYIHYNVLHILLQGGLPSFYVVPYYLDKMKESDPYVHPELFLTEVCTAMLKQKINVTICMTLCTSTAVCTLFSKSAQRVALRCVKADWLCFILLLCVQYRAATDIIIIMLTR
jgi:hypothetical protein